MDEHVNREHVVSESKHPSSFLLQRFALRPDESERTVAEHLATCARCQGLVAECQAEGAQYMSSPSADALRQRLAILDKEEAQRSVARVPGTWLWGGALAVAAAVVFVVSTSGPERAVEPAHRPGPSHQQLDPLTPKGTAQLTLWTGDEGEAHAELAESAVLKPGQQVQPAFGAPSAGFVALVLTAPSGERIRLYPAGGEQSAAVEAAAQAPLGPSFRLDDEAGRYRVTAYFAAATFSTAALLSTDATSEAPLFRGLVLSRQFTVRP